MKKTILTAIIVLSSVGFLFLDNVVRPNFHDLVLLSVLPSFCQAFIGSLMLCLVMDNESLDVRKIVFSSAALCVGCMAYEVSQVFIPGRTFDTNDLIAILVGTIFGVSISVAVFVKLKV